MHPTWGPEGRVYEVWKDSDENKYWVLLNQKELSDPKVINNERVLEYSQQQDNWIIETYRLASDYSITKYYDGYYPNIINDASASLYTKEEYESWVFLHHYLFGNVHKDQYFRGVDFGDTKLQVSPDASQNRMNFYNEAVRQHEAFSKSTGCYFSDTEANNYLANSDYSDIKIIDVGSIELGHVNEAKSLFYDSWPPKDDRIVGPDSTQVFLKPIYYG
jgi:hypothetical protein